MVPEQLFPILILFREEPCESGGFLSFLDLGSFIGFWYHMSLLPPITEYPERRWGIWVLTSKGAKGSFDLRGKEEKEPLTRSLSQGWLPGDVTDVVASGSVLKRDLCCHST